MTCLPSISSLSDNESEDSAQEVESELRMAREAPTPLAARFRNLGRQSPEPAGLVAPPSPPGVDELPSSLRFDSVAPSRSSKPRPGRVPRVRQSQVRSCDQCRTSKQKCDRNRSCASCTLRNIECTWSQAATLPSDSGTVFTPYTTPYAVSSAQVASNRAEITRLRKQADSLARLLRLTAVEFELFSLEAKRLAEGAKGEPVRLPPLFPTLKRPRSSEGEDSADGPAKNRRRFEKQPAHSREQHSSARLSPHQAPLRSPMHSIRGLPSTAPDHRPPGFQRPSIRPDTAGFESSSTLYGQVSVSSERRMVASSSITSSSLDLSRHQAQHSQSSRSILPPLEIPAFAITRPPPSPSHVRRAPPLPTSSSSSYPRRPQYVLPIPNGLSTPVSGSSLLVSLTAPSTTKSLAPVSKPISLSLEPSRYDQVRAQPQTPRSAGSDSRDETEQENVGEKGEKGAEEEASRAVEMPKRLSSYLRNLLND